MKLDNVSPEVLKTVEEVKAAMANAASLVFGQPTDQDELTGRILDSIRKDAGPVIGPKLQFVTTWVQDCLMVEPADQFTLEFMQSADAAGCLQPPVECITFETTISNEAGQ